MKKINGNSNGARQRERKVKNQSKSATTHYFTNTQGTEAREQLRRRSRRREGGRLWDSDERNLVVAQQVRTQVRM